jgi:hypothetical protein
MKLNKIEVGEQYQHQISNRFPALVNLDDSRVINRAWEIGRVPISRLKRG